MVDSHPGYWQPIDWKRLVGHPKQRWSNTLSDYFFTEHCLERGRGRLWLNARIPGLHWKTSSVRSALDEEEKNSPATDAAQRGV